MNVAFVGASSSSNSNTSRPHHSQPPARPCKPRRNSNSSSNTRCEPHGEEPAPYSGAVPPRPPPLDRLSLQNQHPHLLSTEEQCEKLIPHQHQQQRSYNNNTMKEGIMHNNNNNPWFSAKEEEEEEQVDADDRIRHGIALFVADEDVEGTTTTTDKMPTTTMTNNREPDETESTQDCTHSDNNNDDDDDELDRQLWQMAQQPSTNDQQRLQVYWNLCYPDGTTATTTNGASSGGSSTMNGGSSSGKTGAVQPSKSCLNKRSHRTAPQTTSSPNERNIEATRATTPPLRTTATTTATEHSPARKKTHQTTNTTLLTTRTTATSVAMSSSSAIQFAPSSAVEFHEDAPVHEWRVLEDAAQRFPTTGSGASQSDDDDEDETKPSESTWAALFALERENETNPERKKNDETGDADDDDESSLDGGLGRLVPCHGTVSAANQWQVSESSLLSSSDSSLNYTAPSRTSCTNNNNTVLLADFQEGFRMNSDQSLGLHSVASSSVSDRSLTVSLAAAPRSSSTKNNNNTKSNHSTIPFAGFHEGFRMNSDQSLGLASSASSSVVSDRSLPLAALVPPTQRSSSLSKTMADWEEGFRMNSDQSLGFHYSVNSTSSSCGASNNKSGCLHDNDNNTDGLVVMEVLHSSRLLSVPSPTMMGMSSSTTTTKATSYSEYYFKQPRGSRNLMASSSCCLPRDEEATIEPPAASLSSSGCNRSGL